MKMTLYERALQICKERGESLESVADAIGAGNKSLRNWKTSSPKIDTVAAFAKHFGLSIDYVYYGKDANISEEESKLLLLYRNSTDEGKWLVMGNLQASQQDTTSKVG